MKFGVERRKMNMLIRLLTNNTREERVDTSLV